MPHWIHNGLLGNRRRPTEFPIPIQSSLSRNYNGMLSEVIITLRRAHEVCRLTSSSGFSCTTNQPGIQTCYQLATSTRFQAVSCSSTRTILSVLTLLNLVTVTTTQIGPTPTVLETLTTVSLYTMYVPLIRINFQSSDIANSTTSSSTNTVSIASSTSNPSSTASQASTSRTGLGAGAKAGIGIGAALGFVLLALLGFFVYKRRAEYTKARQDSPDIKDQSGVELAQGTK